MNERGRLLVQVLRLSAQLHLSAQPLREDDDEALHRLRIALRSLDALLRLLPADISESLRLRVRACARVSGVLRDYQVLAAQLPSLAGRQGLGLAQATAWLQQTGLLQQLQAELEVWPQQLLQAEARPCVGTWHRLASGSGRPCTTRWSAHQPTGIACVC